MPARNTRKRSRVRTPAQTQEDVRRNWAQRIRASWAKAVKAIVETGKQLIAAKADIDYGQFTHMIYNELPFSGATADRLMKIAKHKVLSQSAHARNLPAHWTTLAELSRLPSRKVLALIKDGTISPQIERHEAESLVDRELARTVRVRVKDVPAAAQTLHLTVVHRTKRITPYYVRERPPDPALDDSTPSGEVEPELRSLAAQATEIIEPPIDRYQVLLAAWKAASEHERARFLAKIKARLLS